MVTFFFWTSLVKGSINDFLKFVDLDIVHTEAATLAFYKVALSYLITHTSYIFRNTLIEVDCPTKASRTLESESWSAQAKLVLSFLFRNVGAGWAWCAVFGGLNMYIPAVCQQPNHC